MNNLSVSNGSSSRTLSPMFFNNCGVLGRNQTVTLTHLSGADQIALQGITLSAMALKESLAKKRKAQSVAKNPARKPRSGKETPNLYIDLFRRLNSYANIPSGVEDLFMGAIRQNTTGNCHNAYVVFSLMKSLPIISTEAVYVMLNQRRVDTEMVGERYAQSLADACRNVIKVFTYYDDIIANYIKELENVDCLESEQFDLSEDAKGYELDRLTRAPITKEQLSQKLFEAGLSFDEVQRYIAGHMIESGSSRYRVSNGGRVTVHGESYYNELDKERLESITVQSLEWLSDLSCYVDVETGEMVGW
ncbi:MULTISPECIES: hypothetical protein [Pectobacterium]|uniref:Uncharacterized protein n=2 Tax=Pectobacterium TaxID=122277 RepID=A0AAW3EI14_9GAMM|nr:MULTISPECIES: hypothetical protein [Pectobacterium]AOR62299.1 hypothetical protein A7983_03250 [Pectobacterium wasabiae CFBP 3304]EJS92962.1 Hypothetical protein Y17_3788 [Pectobacterium wasabiae CFBP 3304]KFX06343.1 hypothetical protein JV38_11520 [Pectobacterium wasabiae]KGA28178.1 hypothetical protein KU73_13085 [Pectobacterium wasabiae]RRO06977.1 hypothetical protein DMB85_015130 [Pectobacterium aquaticum]